MDFLTLSHSCQMLCCVVLFVSLFFSLFFSFGSIWVISVEQFSNFLISPLCWAYYLAKDNLYLYYYAIYFQHSHLILLYGFFLCDETSHLVLHVVYFFGLRVSNTLIIVILNSVSDSFNIFATSESEVSITCVVSVGPGSPRCSFQNVPAPPPL